SDQVEGPPPNIPPSGTPEEPAMLSRLSLPSLGTASLLVLALAAPPSRAADAPAPVPASVTVHPPALELRHQRRPQSLRVLGAPPGGYTLDLPDQARFASAAPRVAVVNERGWVRPVASGQTQVTVAAAGQTRTVPVKVQLPAAEPPYSFRHEVMPVLSRA